MTEEKKPDNAHKNQQQQQENKEWMEKANQKMGRGD